MNMKTVCLVLLMLWTSAVAAVTPSKAKFDVQNMTCAACGITIEKASTLWRSSSSGRRCATCCANSTGAP